jgi:hypothetical protein
VNAVANTIANAIATRLQPGMTFVIATVKKLMQR